MYFSAKYFFFNLIRPVEWTFFICTKMLFDIHFFCPLLRIVLLSAMKDEKCSRCYFGYLSMPLTITFIMLHCMFYLKHHLLTAFFTNQCVILTQVIMCERNLLKDASQYFVLNQKGLKIN